MMQWDSIQNEFTDALRNPEFGIPDTIGKTNGQPSTKRFNVYRNNVTVSLTETLSAGFPVVTQLVGEEFFSAMARVYIEHNIPTSPVMMHYGKTFPGFIASFEPAQSLPFLSDVAKIEFTWTQSYNALDAEPIGIEKLGEIDPEKLMNTKFEIHPSLYMIHSEFPALSIWNAHHQENTEELLSNLENNPEYGIMLRPQLKVETLMLLPQIFAFIKALQEGHNLGAATEKLGDNAEQDLGGSLKLLFDAGAVTALHET